MSRNVKHGIAPDGTCFDLQGPEHAPAIALIHGLGLCRLLWQTHLDALSKNYRVLNYDLYGHGDSAPATETTSLEVYAKQLAGLMDHLELDKAAIVGFSIGGMINRRFAMNYPDKVASLVIVNSPHDRGKERQTIVEQAAIKARENGNMATFDDALKRWFTKNYLATGSGVEFVRRWREQADPESYSQASWVLAHGVRELIKPSTPISKPTLVITCENDIGSTPKMSEDIASEISGADTIIVPHLKHLGLMEEPDKFTKLMLPFISDSFKP